MSRLVSTLLFQAENTRLVFLVSNTRASRRARSLRDQVLKAEPTIVKSRCAANCNALRCRSS